MKRYLTIGMVLGFFLCACEQETILYSSTDNVYFDYTLQGDDTVQVYTFAYTPEVNTDTVYFPVRLSGNRQPFDRKFKAEIYTPYTTAMPGVHYKPMDEFYILKADSGFSQVPVVIYNTDRALDSLSVSLSLKLLSTDELGISFREMHVSTVTFSNQLEKPEWWNYWNDYLIDYSRTKHGLYLIVVGNVDLISDVNSETQALLPYNLFIIDKYRQFLNDPFKWQQQNADRYALEKIANENAYALYDRANPTKVYRLALNESDARYFFIDENGKYVTMN